MARHEHPVDRLVKTDLGAALLLVGAVFAAVALGFGMSLVTRE